MRLRFAAVALFLVLGAVAMYEVQAQPAPGGPRKGKMKAKKRALQQQNGTAPVAPVPASTPAPTPAGSITASTATVQQSVPQSVSSAEQTGEGDVEQAAQPLRAAARRRRAAKVSSEPPAPLTMVNSIKLSTGPDYDSEPALAQTRSGDTYVAFLRYSPDKKDQVIAMRLKGGPPKDRSLSWKDVSGRPGQYVRPVIGAVGDEVWCLWTKTDEMSLASIWYSKLTNGQWSEAARLLPNEMAAHQNPEIATTNDGHAAVAYQVNHGPGYTIECRLLNNGEWGDALQVSGTATTDNWDPVAAFGTTGELYVAWSAMDKGDYDVYLSRIDQMGHMVTAEPRRISARGAYDMHPWLSVAPDGKLWISWDCVKILRHGASGRTTITGANLRDDITTGPQPEHGFNANFSGIEVRVLDGDQLRIPGNPREEIVAPAGYKIAHRALGKVCVGTDGVPWMIYRALCQPAPAWDGPNSNAGYYWELQGRPFRDGKWQAPVDFMESDAYLEEPAVVSTAGGLRVAYSSEHRRSMTSDVSYVTRKQQAQVDASTTHPIEELYDHHHDFDNFLGWDGDIYIAPMGTADAGAAANVAAMPVEDTLKDGPVDTRLTRETGRHSVDMNGQTYNLYWGDTHRHSNVSRCSVGNEPSPDDLYRYGMDINLYDFLALSDHAEHTTDFFWWKQEKTADLYNIPGIFSMLYNYEWSMVFPEGHHNAIFATRNLFKLNGKVGATHTMKGGWELLHAAGLQAITAPHTTADPGMGTDWRSNDEQYQRVCEIFQACRGSYEYDGCPRMHGQARNKAGFYWKGLEKGYHMGIICSSDHGLGCAYACTYSTTNTRESVWQSIWDRRCYGSTTYGLVADVRSGKHWMGEQWSSSEAPPIEIYVRGSAPIRSVEILGRFKTLHAEGSTEQPLNKNEFHLTWTDPEWSTLSGEQWYYVRVIQADDEMAWTSPMWVTKQ